MQTSGRRERRKIKTRQTLSDAALRLFLEHGYDSVTIAQIADEADTAIATLFTYFPDGKESLIFDDGNERREGIVAAVRDRAEGQTILRALREFLSTRGPFALSPSPHLQRTTQLILDTPALRNYQRKLWAGSQDALAEAVAHESGRNAGDMTVRALVRYVLEIPDLAGGEPDPHRALNAIFDLLEAGWPAP